MKKPMLKPHGGRGALLLALALTACVSEDYSPDSPAATAADADHVSVELAMSLSPATTTRMGGDVTQTDGKFHGIQDFYVIPFATRGKVKAADQRLEAHIDISNTITELIENNNAKFYDFVHVPANTASFLVYGHAPLTADKTVSGSLITPDGVIAEGGAPADITFAPDPICPIEKVKTVAQDISDFLTGIAKTSISTTITEYGRNSTSGTTKTHTYAFATPSTFENCPPIVNAFNFLTNSGNVMAGASTAVERLLTKLYNDLYSYANSTSYSQYNGTWYRYEYYERKKTSYSYYYYIQQLAIAIRTAINNSSYVQVSNANTSNATVSLKQDYQNFPASLGLPDGAVGLRWNSTDGKFEVVAQTTTESPILSVDRYCYPASLWYFDNSRIKTSSADWEKEHYVADNDTWADILDEYLQDESVVTHDVQAVAIKDAINYGVACLSASVKSASTLKDNGGANSFTINSSSTIFPLTAILIGQQRKVDFKFEPFDTEEYCAYDPTIAGDNIYLCTNESAKTNTLVLQTKPGEKVTVVLEFQNNSGKDFNGINGLIGQGTKFYLTASLDPTGKNDNLPEVFRQDRQTTVNFTVNSLANAWNVVPDLSDPRLEVGVSVETKWIQSTSTTVKMY